MAEDNLQSELAEKPVREQLKKANIGSNEDAQAEIVGETTPEQTEQPTTQASRHHTRKRSRDSTLDEDELNNGQRKVSGDRPRESVEEVRETNGSAKDRIGTPEAKGSSEAVSSPKIKRSRVHSSTEENGTLTQEDGKDDTADDTAAKIPTTSGFANTSAVSPFGALGGSKSPDPAAQTSSSAFASSGFSALSGSSTSGFGAIGKTTGGFGSGGSFASTSVQASSQDEKPKEGSFGGALGQKSAFATTTTPSTSGFGSSASGFGKLGGSTSGFGSGGGGFGSLGAVAGGGLTSFASGKPSASLTSTSKPIKPFGAPKDDEEEADENDEGAAADDDPKSPLSPDDAEKQDERFYKQDLETGEEGEDTVYTCRAKLYNFAPDTEGKKEWRERGLGTLRLNVTRGDAKPKARFLMRAEGSHRVVLNTPISKDLKFGAPDGGKPEGSYMYFMGTIGDSGGLELLQVKMRAQFAVELWEKIGELQERM